MTKKVTIPDFLIEMSKQINAQDNRITADPIWMVCYDKEYPAYEDDSDHYVWIDTDRDNHEIYHSKHDEGDESKAILEYMEEYCEDWFGRFSKELKESEEEFDIGIHEWDLPHRIKWIPLRSEMEVVKACLTEADANWFINRKKHDYPRLYTYVYSMCYCPQMIELRNWIMSLTAKTMAQRSNQNEL